MNKRVVVISGATGGLGQLVAQAFAKQGASLALLGTNPDKLAALAQNLALPAARLLTYAADLLDAKQVRASGEAVRAHFGRVDVLIHLVGGWTGGKTIAETGLDDFEFMLNQHAWTTIHLLQTYTPDLAANGWGRVIAVTSPLATHPTAKMGAYALGKAAQETLLMTLADQFQGSGVTANVIQVKAIDIKGSGKGTSPAEIIAAMQYLCSDEAAQVNATRLPLF